MQDQEIDKDGALRLTRTVGETCAILGVGKTTIYELFKAKQIQPKKAGRRTLIPMSEIRRFLGEAVA